ncbi:MAG: hypothetical protein AAF620_16530 [Bacteroidota bacterium]
MPKIVKITLWIIASLTTIFVIIGFLFYRRFETQSKRDSFFVQLDKLKRKLPVSKVAFEMEIARALAYADNGHTNIGEGARAKRLNNIPLRFYYLKEDRWQKINIFSKYV